MRGVHGPLQYRLPLRGFGRGGTVFSTNRPPLRGLGRAWSCKKTLLRGGRMCASEKFWVMTSTKVYFSDGSVTAKDARPPGQPDLTIPGYGRCRNRACGIQVGL